jgi:hypothetical protein
MSYRHQRVAKNIHDSFLAQSGQGNSLVELSTTNAVRRDVQPHPIGTGSTEE